MSRYLFIFLLCPLFALQAQVELAWKNVLPNTDTYGIAVSPVADNVLYAKDGSEFLVSYNYGDSWQKRGAIPQSNVRTIVVCPQDTSLIIAFANDGLWRSNDGGYNWQEVLSGKSMNGETLAFHPQRPDSVFFVDLSSGDMFISSDSGATWQKYSNVASTFVCSFAINKYNPQLMIAGAGDTRITRSDDGGLTWEQVKPGNEYYSEVPKIVWDSLDSTRAYGSAYADNYYSVFRSTDGGQNWQSLGIDGISAWAIDLSPVDGRVYLGAFGDETEEGNFVSYDHGESYQRLGVLNRGYAWMIKVSNDGTVYSLSLGNTFSDGGLFRLEDEALGFVKGRVYDTVSGEAAPRGSVTVAGTDDLLRFSNRRGRFLMAKTPGQHDLRIAAGGMDTTVTISFNAGDTSVIEVGLPLDIGYKRLAGKIVNEQGEGIESALVLNWQRSDGVPESFEAGTDAGGLFEFDSLFTLNTNYSLSVSPQVLPYSAANFDVEELAEGRQYTVYPADVILLESGQRDGPTALDYEIALGDLGLSYVSLDEQSLSLLPLQKATLVQKNTAIVYSAADSMMLSAALHDSLSRWLENGMHLLIGGENLLELNGPAQIFAEKLSSGFSRNYQFDRVSDPLTGVAGNAVGDGFLSRIPGFINASPDELIVGEQASPALFYGSNSKDSLKVAAVTVENTGNGGKALVSGFDLNAISDGDFRELLQASFDYFDGISGIGPRIVHLPQRAELHVNYPNPFNPSTEISFYLPGTAHVQLDVYDLQGRHIRTLLNGQVSGGENKVRFEAAGQASGVYFYRLKTGRQVLTKKMVLLR